MRGRSLQRPRREQMQGPRYGPNAGSCDNRYRNDYRSVDRHTVDRERFTNYQNDPPYDCDDEDDVEQQAVHMSRRDRMRERERERDRDREQQREREPPNRQFMRYSEDRQIAMDRSMDRSPRFQRGGRK